MTNKNILTDNSITLITDEVKNQNIKYNLSKFEYDLYHDEDDIVEAVIRVKRIGVANRNEKWKIMNDNKVIFVIEGNKISKKEKEYLQTIEGFNFILSQAKAGIKSLHAFRVELKKIINVPVKEVMILEKPLVKRNKTLKKTIIRKKKSKIFKRYL